MNFER